MYDPVNPTRCLGITQTPKLKQATGEKTLCDKKCSDGLPDTFCQNEMLYFRLPGPEIRDYKMAPLIQNV